MSSLRRLSPRCCACCGICRGDPLWRRVARGRGTAPDAKCGQQADQGTVEAWVDVPLFERGRKRLALTPAGERYEQAVRGVLAQLEAATLELITSDNGGGALHLSSLPRLPRSG